MTPAPDPPLASPAESLFLEHLQRRESGAPESLAELCAAHPRLAPELNELQRRWDLVRCLQAEATPQESLHAAAAPHHGAHRGPPELLDRPRRVIERYVPEEAIARGAQGTVSRALDLDLRRHVAMKVLHGARPGQPAAHARSAARFLDEAQVTAQLDHPGIVPVHDLGLDRDGGLFFTMKLVQGRSLHAVLQARGAGERAEAGAPAAWSRPRIIAALLRVAEAMSFAHDRGVIHRDLKPANVMLGDYGEVYVMDWGLARVEPSFAATRAGAAAGPPANDAPATDGATDGASAGAPAEDGPRTLEGDVVGTPQYMSPEQAEGRLADVGPRSDVYALGAMLYHVLAGRAPYDGGTGAPAAPLVILQRVRDEPPAPVRSLARDAPAELQAICERAMAREPSERYGSMGELAADLRAWLEGRVVRAYQSGPWAELKKWVGRNRALSAASVAALLAVMGGLAWSSHVEAQGRRAAEDASARADSNLRDLRRLSEIKRLAELETRAAALWPASPERLGDLRAWLADARELVGHLDGHRTTLQRVREGTEASNLERSWWEETLAELISRLEAFGATLVPDVERRLAFAESIEERSITAHRAEWDEAIASIGDRARCPQYAGLQLAPQLGLVPIGQDPRSQLWEFWHLQTGDRPERAADGAVVPTDAMGVVLVLLPGGTFAMGAQRDDPGAPGYDPLAVVDEQPVAAVTLDPYFVSKFEMTQAQWIAATGANASAAPAGDNVAGQIVTLHDPVENMTRNEALAAVRNLDLDLPTEAQWEYAARGGTTTSWWTGAERESLRGAENLADATARRAGAEWPGIDEWPDLDDGFAIHGPVGSLRPNPFGLYDVGGNVFEWCRDYYDTYRDNRHPGDGAAEDGAFKGPTMRGGVFGDGAGTARSANRNGTVPEAHNNSVGLRPIRTLRRP